MTEWANLGLERLIAREHANGERVAALARRHGRSRSGIYALLGRCRSRDRREQRAHPRSEPEPRQRRNALARWLSL